MILDRIIADKKEELKDTKIRVPLSELKARLKDAPPVKDFAAAISGPGSVSIIAEVKKASPSKGLIRADFDPVGIARTYEENGAKAISVLTESKYFQGSLSFLGQIREKVNLPLLRKDFIFDEYQVYEARANGADAFLLIAVSLDRRLMGDLYHLGKELGMETLAEMHDEEDMEKVLGLPFRVVGINNRDLKTFNVDIKTTERLIKGIPKDRIVVSESGISTVDDMKYLQGIGARAALIGEALMREDDFGSRLDQLAAAGVSAACRKN